MAYDQFYVNFLFFTQHHLNLIAISLEMSSLKANCVLNEIKLSTRILSFFGGI